MLTLLVCLFLHFLWLCLFLLIGIVGIGIITVVVFGLFLVLFLDLFEFLAYLGLRHFILVFGDFRLLCVWLSFLGLFFVNLLFSLLLLNFGLLSLVFFDLGFVFARGLFFGLLNLLLSFFFLLNLRFWSLLCLGLFNLGLFDLGLFDLGLFNLGLFNLGLFKFGLFNLG